MESDYDKNSIYKNAANFGLILGLTIVIYTLVLHFLGASQNKVAGWASIVFMAVAVHVGTKSFRDKFQAGYISYGRAVGSGMLIVVFGSLIQAFFIYAFYAYISPESLQDIFIAMEDAMMQQGSSGEEIEMAMKMVKAYTGPMSLALTTIFGSAFWGLIISLITSAFLKKEQSIFEE